MAAREDPRGGPALALVEVADVPLGLRALDGLVKEAVVHVLAAGTVQCGHYLLLFGGEVEPVARSHSRATDLGGDALVDEVLLPHAEERIVPAIVDGAVRWPAPGDALGVLQSGCSPPMLRAVDAALKGARVDLVELRLAEGLGGRAIASVWGAIEDVEAAIEIGRDAVGAGRRRGISTAVIPNADEEVGRRVASGTGFFREWRG